jgi:hypothetical protein
MSFPEAKMWPSYVGQVISKNGCDPHGRVTAGHGVLLSNSRSKKGEVGKGDDLLASPLCLVQLSVYKVRRNVQQEEENFCMKTILIILMGKYIIQNHLITGHKVGVLSVSPFWLMAPSL